MGCYIFPKVIKYLSSRSTELSFSESSNQMDPLQTAALQIIMLSLHLFFPQEIIKCITDKDIWFKARSCSEQWLHTRLCLLLLSDAVTDTCRKKILSILVFQTHPRMTFPCQWSLRVISTPQMKLCLQRYLCNLITLH